ncbi:MAG: hypothetical protein CBB60_004445 [Armatimonadetes bacterium Cent15-Ar3]|nr:MAG: hypothetical protein CBB60_004445 [Armatimonadetes bacterium Cent15-Ar3]
MFILFLLLGLYVALMAGIAYLFAFPMRTPLFLSPGFLGTPQEMVEFDDPATGLKLKGWWVPHSAPKGIVICGHGYMMNRAELAPLAPKLLEDGYASLYFDFPACGASQGRRSGLGWRERSSMLAACAWVRAKHPGVPVALIGSSMGSAAAAFAVAENSDCADVLILDSAYDHLSSAIDGWWNFLGGKTLQVLLKPVILLGIPILGLNPFKIRVSEALGKVEKPTLVLHGDRDSLALPRAAEGNFAALKGPKKLVWFEGRNHSEARWEDPERYFSEVLGFLNEHMPSKIGHNQH